MTYGYPAAYVCLLLHLRQCINVLALCRRLGGGAQTSREADHIRLRIIAVLRCLRSQYQRG